MNVVCILLDDMSSDEWTALPGLAAMPSGKWVVFPSYVMASPVCGPSRAGLLSGKHAHHNGVGINSDFGVELDFTDLLPVWLTEADANHVSTTGIYAGMFGKFGNNWPALGNTAQEAQSYFPPGWTSGRTYRSWISAIDGSTDRGDQNYIDFIMRAAGGSEAYYPWNGPAVAWPGLNAISAPNRPGQAADGQWNYTTDVIFWYANRFIEQRFSASPQELPFFLYITPVAPHRGGKAGTNQPWREMLTATTSQLSDNSRPQPATRHMAAPLYGSLPSFAIGSPDAWNFVGGTRTDYPGVTFPGKPAWIQAALANPEHNLSSGAAGGTVLQSVLMGERRAAWESLRAVDEGITSIMNTLSFLGLLEDTCIMVLSDNGFCHGQYRVPGGKLVPYEAALTSRAMIRHPSAPVGNRIEQHVIGNIDVAATVMELMGRSCPATDGTSFAGCLGTQYSWPIPNAHLIEMTEQGGIAHPDDPALTSAAHTTNVQVPPWTGVRSKDWKYIKWINTGEEELYDFRFGGVRLGAASTYLDGAPDGQEIYNRAADPAYADLLALAQETHARLLARDPVKGQPF